MSFWKRLLGGRDEASTGPAKPVREEVHKGFRIAATPYLEGGQYQVAGVVSKEVDGALKEHRFVRADRCGSIEEAAELALMKGRQMIDQQGERVFG